MFVLSDHTNRAPAAIPARPRGSRAARITALGGLPLRRPRHGANQDDEHNRDRRADDVTEHGIAVLLPPASRGILRTAARA